MLFSATSRGFYSPATHGNNIPAGAVEITAAEHAALLAGQSAGQRIVGDANGFPVLQDPPAPTLADVESACLLAIDAAADATYTRLAGSAGRVAEYQRAYEEAAAYQAAGYVGTPGLAVMSWADAKGWTEAQAADDILAARAAFDTALYGIRSARLTAKQAVRDAIGAAAKQAASATAIAQLQVIGL